MSDRQALLTRHISKSDVGIEIAPWHTALVPRREGYNSLILDIWDAPKLRELAAADPGISPDAIIDDVDIIGSATEIATLLATHELKGKLDYIISSHTLEHLPNPIKFLQGCATVLKPHGIVSLAIPSHLGCFDYFRVPTRLSEWITAFRQDSKQPSPAQIFDSRERFSFPVGNEHVVGGNEGVSLTRSLNIEGEYNNWIASPTGYIDAHCSVFTPASFELLIRDAAYLDLVPFMIEELSSNSGEIYACLRVEPDLEKRRPENYLHDQRTQLLQQIRNEEAQGSVAFDEMRAEVNRISTMLHETNLSYTDYIAKKDAYIQQLEEELSELRAK